MPNVTHPRPDFADPCRKCGHVDCLRFEAKTFTWICTNCGATWPADANDPRLPQRDPEAE
jgi:ribosomal protein L40E